MITVIDFGSTSHYLRLSIMIAQRAASMKFLYRNFCRSLISMLRITLSHLRNVTDRVFIPSIQVSMELNYGIIIFNKLTSLAFCIQLLVVLYFHSHAPLLLRRLFSLSTPRCHGSSGTIFLESSHFLDVSDKFFQRATH